MRCRKAQRLLSRRIDAPLAERERVALDRHLGECPTCRHAVERLEGAWNALAQIEAPAAPDDWAAIEARATLPGRSWVPLWLRWEFPSPLQAASVLIVMVVLGATGGVLLSRAALPHPRAVSIEATALADTLSELPWGSPAAGLGGALAGRPPEEKTP